MIALNVLFNFPNISQYNCNNKIMLNDTLLDYCCINVIERIIKPISFFSLFFIFFQNSFGKRNGGSVRRPNECFVLEASEMIVVSSLFFFWLHSSRLVVTFKVSPFYT